MLIVNLSTAARERNLLIGFLLLLATFSYSQTNEFTQSFSPANIAPNGTSILTYALKNTSQSTRTNVAFTDVLTAGLSIPVDIISNSCNNSSAEVVNGNEVRLSGGRLGTGEACKVVVAVKATSAGSYTNTSGNITYAGGSAGTSSATLNVVNDRPTFTKSFSPSAIPFGGRSTLTFTIDNSNGANGFKGFTFLDVMPDGMVVANPANIQSTCPTGLTAARGSSQIAYSTTSSIEALNTGQSCTISVDVIGQRRGTLLNVTSDFTSQNAPFGSTLFSSGVAAAALEVSNQPDLIFSKSFLDDPYQPGSEGLLQFTITNNDRSNVIDNLTFSDDLSSVLSGLEATGVTQMDVCGIGSSLSAGTTINFSGGILEAGATCMFTVPLSVPASATNGSYSNTTSPISGMKNNEGIVSAPATDKMFVELAPIVTTSFDPDTISSGQTTTLEYTLENPSSTDTLSNISFSNAFPTIFQTAGNIPANGTCSSGSSFIFTSLDPNNQPANILVANIDLGPEQSCSFSIDLNSIQGAVSGNYENETSPISAMINTTSAVGKASKAFVTVVGAPKISKSFSSANVVPGGTVDLTFSISTTDDLGLSVNNIAFTDSLNSFIAGTVASGNISNVCGPGSSLDLSNNVIAFSGGSLAGTTDCEFTVSLAIPSITTSGTYTNSTSEITANIGGTSVVGEGASADLNVSNIIFTKEFIDDPVFAGDPVTLEFNITNGSTADINDLIFTDDLSNVVSGLLASSVTNNSCGGTMNFTAGMSNLSYSAGSVAAGGTCSISVLLTVPVGTQPDSYTNTSSPLYATGSTIIANAAIDDLEVIGIDALAFSKTMSPNALLPGTTTTLTFDINNSNSLPATDISFTDNINTFVPGGQVMSVSGTCGGGSSWINQAGVLTLSAGSLNAGASCQLSAVVKVPIGTTSGFYENETSLLDATVNGSLIQSPAASASLQVYDETRFPCESSLSCNPDISVGTDIDQCGAIVNFNPPTDDFDCPNVVITRIEGPASGSIFGTGTTTISFESRNTISDHRDTCSFTIIVTDTEKPTINCPADVTVCEGDAIHLGTANASDNCGNNNTSITNNSSGIFPIGVTSVMWIAIDVAGNADTCFQNVTVHPNPTVSISSSELSEFCQGAALILTATASDAGSYSWSTNETSESIEVETSGTYDVTFTDGNGCSATDQITVTIVPEDLLSAYTIISTAKEVTLKDNTVLNGGVGVMDASEEAKIESGSDISAVTTFVKAASIDIKGGSNVTNQIIGVPNITIPPFKPNTSGGGPDVKIKKNEIVELDGSVYGKIEIDKEAEVTFTSSDISIEDLKVKKDAIIKFEHCAEVKIEKDLDIEKDVTINPGTESVIFYAEKADIKGGAFIQADIYTSKELKAAGTSNSQTFMIGQFIGEKVNGDKDVVWDWNTNCTCNLTSGLLSNDEPVNQKLRDDVVLTNYAVHSDPNPFSTSFRLHGSLLPADKTITVRIVNAQQQLMLKKDFAGNAFDEQIDASEWTNGVYFVSFVTQDAIKTIKVFKVD